MIVMPSCKRPPQSTPRILTQAIAAIKQPASTTCVVAESELPMARLNEPTKATLNAPIDAGLLKNTSVHPNKNATQRP